MIFANTLVRFPFALLSCAAFTVLMLEEGTNLFSSVRENSLAMLIACVFLFVGLRLFAESREQSFANRILEWSAGLIIATFLLFSAEMFDPLSIVSFNVAFITFAMVAPFINARFDHKAMWYFLCRVGVGFVFSGFIMLVLAAGISLIILSLDYLFDVKNVHSYWWLSVISCALVWPGLTMIQIPKDFSSNADASFFAARVRMVSQYLLPSLWMASALVINAYALRIAVVQALPRGKVSILVLVLGLSGFLTYFFGDSGEELLAWPNRIMRKMFGFALLAPLALMGIGIATRIAEYGLTEWRYINVLVLITMSLGVLHFLFRPREKMCRFVLCTLCILSFTSIIPPISGLEMSVSDQRARLKLTLERNGVLVDNRIRHDHPALSHDDLKQISDTLSFLESRKRLSDISEWLGRSPRVVQQIDFIQAMNLPLGVQVDRRRN